MISQRKPSAGILMSTYNGERYLEDQINSILKQSYKNWDLYIRDDGSSDNTINIIKRYAIKHANVHIISDSILHRGVTGSFMYLLGNVNADFYLFCDQDDIWLPDKIQISVSEALRLPEDNPILIVTDLIIVDQNLNKLKDSMWETLHITSIKDNPNYLQVATMYTGCTMMLNNECKNLLLSNSIPNGLIHDQYTVLTVYKYNGIIKTIGIPTILYRQHNNNVLGVSVKNVVFNKIRRILQTIKSNYKYYKIVHTYLGTNSMTYIKYKFKHLINYK